MKKYRLLLTIIFCSMSTFLFASNFVNTIKGSASVEFSCDQKNINAKKFTEYPGGGFYVMDICGKNVNYQCMGTVCEKACTPKTSESNFNGDGEKNGSFHKTVLNRASIEFDCSSSNIKQISHSDSMGQGTYKLFICGKEVIYNCMGTICNSICN